LAPAAGRPEAGPKEHGVNLGVSQVSAAAARSVPVLRFLSW
jgi:hypothetical protein